MLQGAVLKSAVAKIIAGIFPKERGQVVKTGKRGRPVNSLIGDFADDYLRDFPQTLEDAIAERPDLIAGFIDALVANRRDLTEEEALAISTGRDAEAMGLLDGEPYNPDVFTRYNVTRHEGESLGLAFRRRAMQVSKYIQEEANESRKTLYLFVERYAAERNLRDEKAAEKYGMPFSAVGLMSKNIVALVATDNPKAFKGLIARVATFVPEAKTKGFKPKETAQETILETALESAIETADAVAIVEATLASSESNPEPETVSEPTVQEPIPA